MAEQLITRFGVPSITPDGQITSRGTLQVRAFCCGGVWAQQCCRHNGVCTCKCREALSVWPAQKLTAPPVLCLSVQGGWRGGSDGGISASSPMQLKISLSAAEAQLQSVRQEAAAAEAALAVAEQRAQAESEAAATLNVAAAELAAAEAELRACNAQLAAQRAAAADAQTALARAQEELAAKQQLLASLTSSSGVSGGSQSVLAALQREQRRLAGSLASLESAAASAAADLAVAAGRLAAAEDALALAAMPADIDEQLARRRSEANAAAADLSARQAELAAASEAAAAVQQAAEAAGAEVAAAEHALAEAEGRAADVQAAFQLLAAEQVEFETQLEALLSEVPELRFAQPALPPAAEAAQQGRTVVALRSTCTQLARQRQRVLDEQRCSTPARLPLADQLRLREQRAALAAARQQVGTLTTAAQRLQEGIDGSNPQVGWDWGRMPVCARADRCCNSFCCR